MRDRNEEAFLATLAARLGRPRRSGVTPPDWGPHPYRPQARDSDRESLVQAFIESLAALDTPVLRTTRAAFADTLAGVLDACGCRTAVWWDDDRLRGLGVAGVLDEKGIAHRMWSPAADERELRAYAAQADVGITFADMGLAETGTVLLWNGGGRGRPVSLLPPVYVAVLPEASIRPNLTDAVRYVHGQVAGGLPACINFITGPSRTGDIEMDLALGVHGPGVVRVILLRD